MSATTDSESSAQWTLEARDFPAVSRDGQLVALASGELHTTGPPVLALTLEFRSIDSGRKLRKKSFRHPYTGELPAAELGALRKRLIEWVNGENAALASADLIPIPPLEQRDPCATADEVVQRITAPPLDVSLEKTRLVVRQHGRVFVNRDHANWMVTDERNPSGNCRYRPVLSGVFVDGARRALVVRADYCSPGDSCAEGVPPRFSVQRLPQ